MPKGTVTTKEGKKYKLVPREETGLVDCPGEAHSNPFIDNCGLCAPRWGKVMSYKPVELSAVVKGVAVPVNATYANRDWHSPNAETFKAAEKAGKVAIVMVTEKTRAMTSSFFAYVLA